METRDPDAPKETRGWLATAETEADCEEIFREWLRHAKLPCPYCGSMEPTLELTTRRVLQCRCCGEAMVIVRRRIAPLASADGAPTPGDAVREGTMN